jgi:hypothetical protein
MGPVPHLLRFTLAWICPRKTQKNEHLSDEVKKMAQWLVTISTICNKTQGPKTTTSQHKLLPNLEEAKSSLLTLIERTMETVTSYGDSALDRSVFANKRSFLLINGHRYQDSQHEYSYQP